MAMQGEAGEHRLGVSDRLRQLLLHARWWRESLLRLSLQNGSVATKSMSQYFTTPLIVFAMYRQLQISRSGRHNAHLCGRSHGRYLNTSR